MDDFFDSLKEREREIIKPRQVIEVFLGNTIHEIKDEMEVPNINFIFDKDGYNLFKKVIDNPLRNIGSWKTPTQDDLLFLINHSNEDCLTINVNDTHKFFKLLTNIINETIELNSFYVDLDYSILTIKYLLRRIWLRMGINDVENINYFLNKQLQFVKNRTFDTHNELLVDKFHNYDVFMKTNRNELWDETTRSMIFTIKNDNIEYELPHILYDIDDENNCYIYGVQSSQNEKDKSIERKLYYLNKNIENPNVHPSKVYSMLLFIKKLKEKNISKIVIPSMQVLSFHYHELLSIEAKKRLDGVKNNYEQNPNNIEIKNRYEYYKSWYDHVYQKEDKISYLKTEELINLMYRLTEHDKNIEITNDINIQGDSLNLKIK